MAKTEGKAKATGILAGFLSFVILAILPLNVTDDSLGFFTVFLLIASSVIGFLAYYIQKP